MRVSRQDTIAGHPALEVRRLFREIHSGGMSPDLVRRVLSIDGDEEASGLIETLERDGFVERRESRSIVGGFVHVRWYPTLKGSALAGAPASKPIRRVTASRHLAALLNRVEQLRHRDFLCDERSKNANRSFNTFLDDEAWPEVEVHRFLRSRARSLAIRWKIDDFIWGRPFEVAYVDPAWIGRWSGAVRGYCRKAASDGILRIYHDSDAVPDAAPIDLTLKRPLILETPDRLRDALRVQGAVERSEDEALQVVSRWARAGGHDGVVIPASALTGAHLAGARALTLIFV
jgi:hypothetical protein